MTNSTISAKLNAITDELAELRASCVQNNHVSHERVCGLMVSELRCAEMLVNNVAFYLHG